MQKFTVNPPWLRLVILILAGLSCLTAGVALAAYLLTDSLPPLGDFVALLFAFLLNGCIFIFAFTQEGPLREAFWVHGTLTAIAAVLGILALVFHPEQQPFASWVRPLFIVVSAVLVFWVANTRVKVTPESEVS